MTFQVSSSQIDTWRLCHRKWWLEKQGGAMRLNKGYFEFGHVLHSVLERHLGADDRGVDTMTGQPVELYPEGWGVDESSGVEVSVAEQDLIRRLVTKAIDEGVVRRLPGRKVEHAIRRLLFEADTYSEARGDFPDPTEPYDDLEDVVLVGYVDVRMGNGVEDHKTMKSWKYAETGESLQQNSQVLIYLWDLIEELREQGEPVPDKMYVRHNQFSKDPSNPRVSFAEGWVTPAQVDQHIERCKLDVAEMLADREKIHWRDVAGPTKMPGNACRAYGGCDNIGICTGRHDVASHNRLTTLQNQDRLQAQLNPHQGATMSATTLSDLMAKRASAQATPPADGPAPEINSEVDTTEPAAEPAAGDLATTACEITAPWYFPDCPACTKNPVPGIASSGGACRICDVYQRKADGITSAMFDIKPGEAGMLTWTPKKGGKADAEAEGTAPLPNGDKEVAATKGKVETDPPPASATVPADATSSPEDHGGVITKPAEPAKPAKPPKALPAGGKGRGRPKKGFTLLIGCRPGKGHFGTVIHLSDVLAAHIAAIEEATPGDDSFWSLDAFRRRDTLVDQVPLMAEAFGTNTVVADISDLIEHKYVLAALRMTPTCNVIEAVA